MNVLFALGSSTEQTAKNIADRYYEKYGEVLEYTNKYFFKALLDEIKVNKTYDRIVINEDFEETRTRDIELFDRMIFNYIDQITDEIEDADIILICTDRRRKGDAFVNEVFRRGIYNLLMGDDRNINPLCEIIRKPKTKKEAKVYLNINPMHVGDTALMRDDDVDEAQILSILAYYENIKNKPEEFVSTFNRIKEQYSRPQLKTILNSLPNNVRNVILAADEFKYLGMSSTKVPEAPKQQVQEQPSKHVKSGWSLFGGKKKNKIDEKKSTGTVEIASVMQHNGQVDLSSTREEQHRENLIAKGKEEAKKIELERQANERKKVEEARKQAELEEKARKEAEARRQVELAEKARKEVEARQQAALEEKARKEAEARQQAELAEKARKEVEARQQAALEEKARKEAEARQQAELAERARKEAEARQQAELAERARKEAEARQQAELAERARKEAEARQQAELAERARKEAEARQQAELAEKARKEAEARKQAELEEKARKEAEANRKVEEIKREQESLKRKQQELMEKEKVAEDAKAKFYSNTNQVQAKRNVGEDGLIFEVKPNPNAPDRKTEKREFHNVNDGINNIPLVKPKDNNLSQSTQIQVELTNKLNPNNGNNQAKNLTENKPESPNKSQTNLDIRENNNTNNLNTSDNKINKGTGEIIRPMNNEISDQEKKIREEQERLEAERRKIREEQERIEAERRKIREEQEKLENARNKLKNTPAGYEEQAKMYSNNMPTTQLVSLNLKKMIVFVGANKAGTTFVTNAVAHAIASTKIRTAILDMTRDKSMFYLYNQNDKSLRKKAEECMQRMSDGEDYYLDTMNSYLKVYTTTPGSISDVRRTYKHKSIIDVATSNSNLVIVDADFTTPIDYFEQASEIYLVQDLDLLKMPDATLFLRELKNRGMDMKKIRIIINKYVKTSLTPKQIVQSLSYYSDPSMSFVDDLLPSKVDYWMIPYNLNNYAKYIDSVCHGVINYKGYSTDFMEAINEITSVIYPKITGGNSGKSKRFFG